MLLYMRKNLETILNPILDSFPINSVARRRITKMMNSHSNKRNQSQREFPATSILDLPTVILILIFSKVTPLKTLLRCRFVCRLWRSVISSIEFAQLHFPESYGCLLLRSGNHRRRTSPRKLCLVDPQSFDGRRLDKITLDSTLNLPYGNFEIFNSCNGFLLITCPFQSSLYVLNPLTGECITIPLPIMFSNCTTSNCYYYERVPTRLGFCPHSKKYKLVRFVHRFKRIESSMIEIYTIGAGLWRKIEWDSNSVAEHMIFDRNAMVNEVFLNGTLHWIEERRRISTFNFEDEQFGSVSLPSCFEGLEDIILRLGALGGRLILCARGIRFTIFDVWTVSSYGDRVLWTKKFSIDDCLISSSRILPGTREMLLLRHPNRDDGMSDEVSLVKDQTLMITAARSIQTISYVPSFISIKETAMEEEFSVVETADSPKSFSGSISSRVYLT